MFNPYAVFAPEFLNGFRKKGVKAFVQQTYNRGKNLLEEPIRPAYLLIHTDDIGLAQEHYDAIKSDPNRRMFVLSHPPDMMALQQMLAGRSAHYYTLLLVKDAKAKAKKILDKKNRAFINYKTNWQPHSWEQVQFDLDIIFGEIYVKFKHGPREIKVKLEEIENQKDYVL